jgi:hypothetical protein
MRRAKPNRPDSWAKSPRKLKKSYHQVGVDILP